jgi:hypothetical protein
MAKYWSRAERPVEAYLAGMTCRAAGVSRWPLAQRFFGGTHVEGVGEVKDVVVEGEGVGGDDIDTGSDHGLQVGETGLLSDGEELIGGDLVGPVSLESCTHAHDLVRWAAREKTGLSSHLS